MAGGASYNKAVSDAQAKGQAEAQAQAQREAQQKAQSIAAGQKATGVQTSHGFDAAGNRLNDKGQIVQFASTQARDSYLAARGLGNTGQIINPDIYAKADFSNLAGISSARQEASTVSPTFKPEENYGYTTKVSPIVSQNFVKNPLESNWELSKNRQAEQARRQSRDFFSSDQGGVKTAASEALGAKYSWKNSEKITESIGSKIFSNQTQLVMDSAKEQQVKQSQAEKAFTGTPSTSNKDYITGGTKEPGYNTVVTLGKEQKVFGNKDSFGWDQVSKNQLSRGSAKEDMFVSGNAKVNQKGGIDYTVSLLESLGVSSTLGGSTSKPDVIVPQGTSVLSDKEFRSMLTTEEKQGAEFYFISSGKKIGKTSGARSYHDYLKAQQKYPDVVIQTFYPQVEKSIIENVKQNPDFFSKEPQSYWTTLGQSGFISAGGMKQVNSILHANWYQETVPIRAQDKAFRESLTNVTNAGLGFNIKDKSGDIVATTSGARSYHDYLKAQKTFGKDVTIEPNYEWPVGDYLGKLNQPTKTEPSGKPTDFFAGLSDSAKSFVTNLYALGLSTYQFAQKPDKSLNLGFGAKIPYSEQARQNIIGSLTIGIDINKLSQGKIVYDQNIKLTPEGEKIQTANNQPSWINLQLGLEKPTKPSEYYAGGVFFSGVILGVTVDGLKDSFPIGVKSIGKFTTEEGKTVSNSFLVVGSESVGYRGLLGRTTSGWKFGGPTYARVRPEGSSFVVENPQRGTEIATPNRFASDFLSSKGYWEQVTKIGKSSTPYEGDLVQYTKTMNKVLANPETNIQRSTVIETQREGLSEATVKGGLTGISEKQGALNFFNLKTGKAGKIQGSTSTEQFLPSDILEQSKAVAPAHDIDVIKSNPLGIFEERQAQNLAKFTNIKIQEEQGIAPSLNVVYRGMPKEKLNKLLAGQISLSETSTSSEVYTSPEASTAQFFGNYNNPGKQIGVARIELTSESDILRFKDVPKSELGVKNPINNWRKANPILIDYAKSKGKAGIRKPVKTGGEETILFGDTPVKDISAVPSNIRFTEVIGRKIYEGKEKAIEFVTRKDETGSGLGKSGSVYGISIDTKTFKSTVKGTDKTAKHTSGIFQAQTNLAKIGIQTKESAKAQSATEEQLKIIGEGEIFSPELFAEKAIIRPYYQTLATSRELLKNPETKAEALKGIEAAHAMRYYRFDNPETALFKWESKPNQTVDDFLKESKADSSTLAPRSRLPTSSSIVTSTMFSGKIPTTSRTSNLSEESGSSIVSSAKPRSGASTSSSKSSSISSALSSLSSKSGSSILYTKSGKSSSSSKSGISSILSVGSKSSPGPSSSSSTGSSSLLTSSSSTSRTTSSFTPGSSITTKIFQDTSFTFKPKLRYSNIGIRRKGRSRSGPTALYQLNVKNVFAGSLDIKVPKNRRFIF